MNELRADPRTRTVPVILLSARAGAESTVEALAHGADDYLVKPFSAGELIARVRTQLEMFRLRREVIRGETEREQLRTSVEARDEFLNLVSHELRTPVSALSLALRSAPQPQVAERQLNRLKHLVEQLVSTSELMSGGITLQPQPVDVRALAENVVEGLRGRAANAGTVVELDAPAAVTGSFDPGLLRRLLDNLIDNAVKFGGGKPVEVRVSREKDTATISVIDHGPGLPEADAERVFERFERRVSTRNFGGFGLGLWSSRQIVDAHAGRISVAPTDGGGATFRVELPLSR